jgi:hypothetical protein
VVWPSARPPPGCVQLHNPLIYVLLAAGVLTTAVFLGLTMALNALFGTAPVGLGSWLYAAGAGSVAFVLVEADKMLRGTR